MRFELTEAGRSLVDNAISGLTKLELTNFNIGSAAALTFNPAATDVTDFEYTSNNSQITWQQQTNQNRLKVILSIPEEDRDFVIGNAMIFVNGTPFAHGILDRQIARKETKLIIQGDIFYTNILKAFDSTPLLDATRMLSFSLMNNPAWEHLAKSVSTVLNREIVSPRTQLANIRDTSFLDRDLAIKNARQLGGQYFSDKLEDDDIERLSRYASLYYPGKGSTEFYNFLAFFKNFRADLYALWTENYLDFFIDPRGVEIERGGDWFPSSHVEIRYDLRHYPNPLLFDMKELFYRLAPIHLVLERIVATYYFYNTDCFIGTKGHTTQTQHAHLDFLNNFQHRIGFNAASAATTTEFNHAHLDYLNQMKSSSVVNFSMAGNTTNYLHSFTDVVASGLTPASTTAVNYAATGTVTNLLSSAVRVAG